MALVNIQSALGKAVTALRKSPVGQGLEILSYKRNRGVSVFKVSEGEYRVVERGYQQTDLLIPEKQLSKILKTVIKREFPRSRKVRIYHLEDQGQLGLERKKL